MTQAVRPDAAIASPSRRATTVSWAAQLVAAVILGQTLFFKFTAAPESVWIFQTLGVEPWGRWASGAAELVAVILLLMPRTAAYGAVVAAGVMVGAIGSHLTRLGIEIQGDGGLLFGLALVVTCASAVVIAIRWRTLAARLGWLRGLSHVTRNT